MVELYRYSVEGIEDEILVAYLDRAHYFFENNDACKGYCQEIKNTIEYMTEEQAIKYVSSFQKAYQNEPLATFDLFVAQCFLSIKQHKEMVKQEDLSPDIVLDIELDLYFYNRPSHMASHEFFILLSMSLEKHLQRLSKVKNKKPYKKVYKNKGP